MDINGQVCYYIEANAKIPIIEAKAYEITYFYYMVFASSTEMIQEKKLLKNNQLRRILLNGTRPGDTKHIDGDVLFNNNGGDSQELRNLMRKFLGIGNLFNGSLVDTNSNNQLLKQIRNVYEHLCVNIPENKGIFNQVIEEAISRFMSRMNDQHENKIAAENWQLISLIDILYLIYEYEIEQFETAKYLNNIFKWYKPINIKSFTDLKGHFSDEKRWYVKEFVTLGL